MRGPPSPNGSPLSQRGLARSFPAVSRRLFRSRPERVQRRLSRNCCCANILDGRDWACTETVFSDGIARRITIYTSPVLGCFSRSKGGNYKQVTVIYKRLRDATSF